MPLWLNKPGDGIGEEVRSEKEEVARGEVGAGRLISGVVWGFLMGAQCPGRPGSIGWLGLGKQPC
jgi:hypothetical protein